MTTRRRTFLGYLASLPVVASCADDGVRFGPEEAPPAPPTLPAAPFALGVASGDPDASSVILWTRLAPDPSNGGGMTDRDIPVIWEVAHDEAFEELAQWGWSWATPAFAHSVHAEARGLDADRWYYYRFRIGDAWTSPTGRTRTLPKAGRRVDAFRVVSASCQNYQAGYYHAHRYLADEGADLVTFLGDYIYEGAGRDDLVRSHDSGRLETLDDFRNRYGLYKLDADLQAAHAACPWVVTWDDHEVSNNYADLNFEADVATSEAEVRRAAYQAYYEHMPVRLAPPADFVDWDIYRSLEVGRLLEVFVLDTRQYRSPQACGGEVGPICDEVNDPARSFLGEAQRQWLLDGLRASDAQFKVIAQQVMFGSLTVNDSIVNPDQWDGYAADQQALLDLFHDEAIENVIVLTGDIHSAGFIDLHVDKNDVLSPKVGQEIITTSISSGGDEASGAAALGPAAEILIDHIQYFEPAQRGYTVIDFDPAGVTVQYRYVSTVTAPEATLADARVYRIDAGTLATERLDEGEG